MLEKEIKIFAKNKSFLTLIHGLSRNYSLRGNRFFKFMRSQVLPDISCTVSYKKTDSLQSYVQSYDFRSDDESEPEIFFALHRQDHRELIDI